MKLKIMVLGLAVLVTCFFVTKGKKPTEGGLPISMPGLSTIHGSPEEILEAQSKLNQSTEQLEKTLIPMLKRLPEDVKKFQELAKINEQAIAKLKVLEAELRQRNQKGGM